MRVLGVVGTRPEGIKLAPLIRRLLSHPEFECQVCVTGQHREMLDQALAFFDIVPDYDLAAMREGQTLNGLAGRIFSGLQTVLEEVRPDLVVVQGDTTTTFTAAMAAFQEHIPVGHVEAGLRTANLFSPWPEEANRRLTSVIARQHYAPTRRAYDALLDERVPEKQLFLTGNTVVDALNDAIGILDDSPDAMHRAQSAYPPLNPSKRALLVTSHRRESFGDGLEEICAAVARLADRQDVEVFFPVHLNPNVREPVCRVLGNHDNVHLLDPLDYPALIQLMRECHLVLTDSGGIQEEAPTLGKPVLVMRNTTERPEGIEAGTAELVGTDRARIVDAASILLDDHRKYEAVAQASNPYGDGRASERIVAAMFEHANR